MYLQSWRDSIFSAEQKLESIPLDNILQNSDPVLHQRLRISCQIVGFTLSGNFKSISAICPGNSALFIQNDQSLGFPMDVMLEGKRKIEKSKKLSQKGLKNCVKNVTKNKTSNKGSQKALLGQKLSISDINYAKKPQKAFILKRL